MIATSWLRVALPLALALGGCKEQPIDGAGGAIVKPLDKKSLDHKSVDHKALTDVKAPPLVKDARIEDIKSLKPAVEIVAPDMTQTKKIIGPNMIQGQSPLPQDAIQGDTPLPPDGSKTN